MTRRLWRLEAADIRTLVENAGTSLKTGDLVVAATAHQHNGTLATANTDDFDREPIHELFDLELVSTTR